MSKRCVREAKSCVRVSESYVPVLRVLNSPLLLESLVSLLLLFVVCCVVVGSGVFELSLVSESESISSIIGVLQLKRCVKQQLNYYSDHYLMMF